MAVATNTPAAPQLEEDTIDDLLYYARTGDLTGLQSDVSALSAQQDISPLSIICSVTDSYSGNTLIHYASANGHSDIIAYILSLSPSSATPLLTRPNTTHSTPLHYAALNGHLSICKLLLESTPKGSALNDFISAKNNAGRDAAFEAESAEKEDVVTYLLGVMDDVEAGTNGDGDINMSAGESSSGNAEEEVEEATDGMSEMQMSEGEK